MSYASDPQPFNAEWERSRISGGGEKATLRSNKFGPLGTVVRLPGTVARIFWPGGETQDVARFDDGIRLIEERYGI